MKRPAGTEFSLHRPELAFHRRPPCHRPRGFIPGHDGGDAADCEESSQLSVFLRGILAIGSDLGSAATAVAATCTAVAVAATSVAMARTAVAVARTVVSMAHTVVAI